MNEKVQDPAPAGYPVAKEDGSPFLWELELRVWWIQRGDASPHVPRTLDEALAILCRNTGVAVMPGEKSGDRCLFTGTLPQLECVAWRWLDQTPRYRRRLEDGFTLDLDGESMRAILATATEEEAGYDAPAGPQVFTTDADYLDDFVRHGH